MATARNVIDRLVAIIEAVTADTEYDGTTAFVHEQRWSPDDAADDASPTRLFGLWPLGDLEHVGPIRQGVASRGQVRQSWALTVLYYQGEDPLEAQRVICEDVDRLQYALQTAGSWQQSTTGISNVEVDSYDATPDPDGGGVTVVTMPVAVTYWPSF